MEDDWLTDDEELDGPIFKTDRKDITRSHFVASFTRDRCATKDCPVSFLFPSMRRRHHCRRCGEVFCRDCLRHRRRLNVMAQPDAKGISYRVCIACYIEREFILEGVRRSRTKEFFSMRSDYLEERRKLVCDVTMEVRKASKIPTFWKEQFEVDIPKECQRLLEGFEDEIGSSETMRTIEEVQSLVKIPHWQKSTFWELEKSTTSCRECRSNIAGIRKKRNCRVCGLTLCKKCAHKELLLYYKDGYQETAIPRLAIIRIQGSPEVEPKYSLLLYICDDCRNFIKDKQLIDPDWFIKKPKPPDVTSQLHAMDGIFRDLVQGIENKITELEETVKSGRAEAVKQNGRSSVFGLVQSIHDIDLKRELETKKQSVKNEIDRRMCRYFSLYTKLRTLRQEHKDKLGQSLSKLLNNYIKCRNEFYIKTKSKVTSLTKSSTESLISLDYV